VQEQEKPSMNEHEVLEEIERTLDEISRRQVAREKQEQTSPQPQGETEAPDASPPEQDEPPELVGTPIIHVYVVDAPPSSPLEEDERIVESTLEVAAEEAEDGPEDESELPLPVTHPLSLRGRRVRMPLFLLVLCLLMGSALLFVALVPLFTASATVTIIPTAVEINGTTTVTLVSGTTRPGSGQQVAGRLLSTLTLSQEQVTSTTGIGHQPEQAAHGLITFYNALPAGQTVPVGTLLIGADGVQVVTEADANIPAAQMPTEGQVSVTAHALAVGPSGNIRSNDLYGPCCRADVFAQNSAAFHGGQNARDFPMVTPQDVSGAVTTLKASLQASVQAALLTQARPGETLITPVPCTPKVSANHAAGEEATHLRVRLDETCTGETYDTQAVQTLLTQALTQEATQQAGPGYTLTGAVQVTRVTVTPSPVKEQLQHVGTLVLLVKGTGTWAYQFSDPQLRHMAQLITGKSRQEATTVLLEQRGVSQVAMTVSGMEQTSLPADAGRIHLLVLSRSA
jgi:VCBS repeat-containing protein